MLSSLGLKFLHMLRQCGERSFDLTQGYLNVCCLLVDVVLQFNFGLGVSHYGLGMQNRAVAGAYLMN